jgi:hypothetical protein
MYMRRFDRRKPITPKDIRDYYLKNFEQLDKEQQIHLAWALYSWNKVRKAYRKLLSLKPYLTGNGNFHSVWQRLEQESKSNAYGKGKMADIQVRYFSRHPGLLAKTWQLLYLLRLQTIYGIDVRPELLRYHSPEDFERTFNDLQRDPEAIAMLSAAAINYIYLYHHFLLEDTETIKPVAILNMSEPFYDVNNGMHLKIQSYLYTHLVIGESLFFNRDIPGSKLNDYQDIMLRAETFLAKYYFEHSLDNKYEFLACAHFVGNSPRIEPIIMSEATHSFFESESFTFDRFNINPNKHEPGIANMAHSMAFYLLCNKKRSPSGP